MTEKQALETAEILARANESVFRARMTLESGMRDNALKWATDARQQLDRVIALLTPEPVTRPIFRIVWTQDEYGDWRATIGGLVTLRAYMSHAQADWWSITTLGVTHACGKAASIEAAKRAAEIELGTRMEMEVAS